MKNLLLSFILLVLPFFVNAQIIKIDGLWYAVFEKSKTMEVIQYRDSKYVGNINIPEKVTYNGTEYSVTSIGEEAFFLCESLTSITIPNSVTTIGDFSFAYCYNLTSIIIPNSVTTIGDWAFVDYKNLTDVYCYAEDVPNTNSTAFDGSNIENATLHVPESAIEKYKTTEPWNRFGSFSTTDAIINIPSTTIIIQSLNGTLDIDGLPNGTSVSVYTTTGTEVVSGVAEEDTALTLDTRMQKGDIAVVKMGTKSVKVMMK